MAKDRSHNVMVIDQKTSGSDKVCQILEAEDIPFVCLSGEQQVLSRLRAAAPPFTMVIAEQHTQDKGALELLEKARRASPRTIRVIISDYSEMASLFHAVNKGAVDTYIVKPWKKEEMEHAIRFGIAAYDKKLEKAGLFSLAKTQNTKLYRLTCELVETAKNLDKELASIEQDITAIEEKSQAVSPTERLEPADVLTSLDTFIKTTGESAQQELVALFRASAQNLYDEFNDLALRNGFEMPEFETGAPDD